MVGTEKKMEVLRLLRASSQCRVNRTPPINSLRSSARSLSSPKSLVFANDATTISRYKRSCSTCTSRKNPPFRSKSQSMQLPCDSLRNCGTWIHFNSATALTLLISWFRYRYLKVNAICAAAFATHTEASIVLYCWYTYRSYRRGAPEKSAFDNSRSRVEFSSRSRVAYACPTQRALLPPVCLCCNGRVRVQQAAPQVALPRRKPPGHILRAQRTRCRRRVRRPQRSLFSAWIALSRRLWSSALVCSLWPACALLFVYSLLSQPNCSRPECNRLRLQHHNYGAQIVNTNSPISMFAALPSSALICSNLNWFISLALKFNFENKTNPQIRASVSHELVLTWLYTSVCLASSRISICPFEALSRSPQLSSSQFNLWRAVGARAPSAPAAPSAPQFQVAQHNSTYSYLIRVRVSNVRHVHCAPIAIAIACV